MRKRRRRIFPRDRIKIDIGAVIDGIIVVVLARHPPEIDLVGMGDAADVDVAAGQADRDSRENESDVGGAAVAAYPRCGSSVINSASPDRPMAAKLICVSATGHHVGQHTSRAMSEAEIDQQHLRCEIGVGARRAPVRGPDKRERPADRALLLHITASMDSAAVIWRVSQPRRPRLA